MKNNILELKEHLELIKILEELINVIVEMRKTCKEYLLMLNEEDARDWLNFLKNHVDKEELDSLEKEIAKRYVSKFDVLIADHNWDLDRKKYFLMEKYLVQYRLVQYREFKNI